MSKFLVLWSLDISKLSQSAIPAVCKMPDYAEKLTTAGKLEKRYHIVGKHGGAWIYDVSSNEELDLLLAQAPVYNLANYEVIALAEMTNPLSLIPSDSKGVSNF